MNEQLVSLGFSPCPNDTYIFHALVHGKIFLPGLKLSPVHLEDVETLNEWAISDQLDVTKLSFHALGLVRDRYTLLQAGSALGRGCGPLLITGPGDKPKKLADWKIAIPGKHTTAALLLKLYAPECQNLVTMRFDEIMDALAQQQVDGGVIIHESRFTYQQQGLEEVQDLGEWWEHTTHLPIPLGCIVARRSLGTEIHGALTRAIRESIIWADQHPQGGMYYRQSYAQEMDTQVMQNHIDLYVNDFSKELGEEGLAAIRELLHRGEEAGVFPQSGYAL